EVVPPGGRGDGGEGAEEDARRDAVGMGRREAARAEEEEGGREEEEGPQEALEPRRHLHGLLLLCYPTTFAIAAASAV
ncbi:unnamed protein product, partial [Urochloa humidicola]